MKGIALWHPSPNYGENRLTTDFIIIHGTAMDSDDAALARLCDPEVEVSCHYYIDYDGVLHQLVAEEHVAWHAGVSKWGEVESLNKHSIGIEVANPVDDPNKPYTPKQYETLKALLLDLQVRHKIPPENVLGHEDIAPGRKTDPGEYFDWSQLTNVGLAVAERAPEHSQFSTPITRT